MKCFTDHIHAAFHQPQTRIYRVVQGFVWALIFLSIATLVADPLLPEDEWDITVAGLPVYWIFPNVILMPFEVGVFLVRTFPDRNDPARHLKVTFPEVAT